MGWTRRNLVDEARMERSSTPFTRGIKLALTATQLGVVHELAFIIFIKRFIGCTRFKKCFRFCLGF